MGWRGRGRGEGVERKRVESREEVREREIGFKKYYYENLFNEGVIANDLEVNC